MSTYSESTKQVPTPKSLAGYQLVENGDIRPWDLLIPSMAFSHKEWQWADDYLHVGSPVGVFKDDYNIYRKMPCPHAGDHDKVPGTDKTYGEMRADALPDSGERKAFDTGAVRDASKGKGHFHSIPPTAMRHLAKRFEDGAAKYAKDNWMKGIALSHYEDSLTRHILAWKEGQTDEDHAGAIIWNACCMVWTDEQIKAGKLPASLDDLPYRK